jgi:hypothetical protein
MPLEPGIRIAKSVMAAPAGHSSVRFLSHASELRSKYNEQGGPTQRMRISWDFGKSMFNRWLVGVNVL